VSSGDAAPTERAPVRVHCLSNPTHDELVVHLKNQKFVWVDLVDPDADEIARIGKLIALHPITVENANNYRQRPKLEWYEGYMFLVMFAVDPETASGDPLLREVNMIISGDYVFTIHKRPLPSLIDLREQYQDEEVRSEQFFVYEILDAITSTFTTVLTRVDDDIDQVEEEIIDDASPEQLQRIFSLKRDLVAMRRVITPMRDLFAREAERINDLPGLETDDRLYYRDLHDTLIRTSELVDSYRDLLSGATDMYLSTVANRQGEINKQLTVIATIFLPLTFLTGFFGQNFKYLVTNVISSTWSFWVFGVGFLVASVIGFWIYFRRKQWA
jgi:magnesium transporter